MGKLDSLFKLHNLGLNTPKLLAVVENSSRLPSNLSERVSVRTEKPGASFKEPHFPNVLYSEVKKDLHKLLRSGYSIYIFEAINPRECVRKGTVMQHPEGTSFVFEWKDGPGTVRDLEKLVPETREYPGGIGVPEDLRQPLSAIRTLGTSGLGMILEWSIYPYPVGRLQWRDIYWELRPWR